VSEHTGEQTIREEVGTCLYEKDGPIARVILNRPEKANAQNSALAWDFDACLKKADADYDVKVVIIKANGRGFCSGHESGGTAPMEERYPDFARSLDATGQTWKGQLDLFVWPVLYLWEFPKPTISQVHGYALGGGTYFAWLPDIVIASEDAYFQMPLVHGLGLPGGETMIEPWVFMNYHRAAKYLYTAETLTAAQCLEMGLVNEVVPLDQLEARVEELAATISRAPLSTLMYAKAGLKRAWEHMGMRTHLQGAHDLHTLAAHARDVREWFDASGGGKPRDRAARNVAESG
jgi:enoyl-CoA hydratase